MVVARLRNVEARIDTDARIIAEAEYKECGIGFQVRPLKQDCRAFIHIVRTIKQLQYV
jgi:hypothetical protein